MDKLAKVRAEIERLKEIAEYNLSHSKMDRGAWMQQASVCTNLLSFIDSMQKEPKECMYSKDNYTDEDRKVLCEGCEEECKYVSNIPPVFDEGYWERLGEKPVSEDLEQAIRKYEQRLEKENPATEAYDFAGAIRFGANWQKQQLMAKAVDATVDIDAGGYPYIPQMELYDYDKDIPLAKEGDKYKVVLIKE